ncbi:hypothetical protein K432DRAFT_381160 [Lepidopterella palustris CBS 459.81]|uniref:Uncharacterized protein n=1 Tax=Lepidopterella palustris CBS 459.81 TaxID=1314670 RepID=A0A8E2ECR9_9PEZI|nr:hypothetical protein K432DRAFT_381160 [Lepidopterella palustris CBS 459.81]
MVSRGFLFGTMWADWLCSGLASDVFSVSYTAFLWLDIRGPALTPHLGTLTEQSHH